MEKLKCNGFFWSELDILHIENCICIKGNCNLVKEKEQRHDFHYKFSLTFKKKWKVFFKKLFSLTTFYLLFQDINEQLDGMKMSLPVIQCNHLKSY